MGIIKKKDSALFHASFLGYIFVDNLMSGFSNLFVMHFQVARGGQSVTLFGSKLIMFGGEDKKRRLLNDIYVLDLETQTWSSVETT